MNNTPVTEQTRDLLDDIFQRWNASADMSVWLDALSDNSKWTVTGSAQTAGVYTSKKDYVDNVLNKLNQWVVKPPVPNLQKLVVENNWATAWLAADAESLDGKKLTIDYCWIVRIEKNKVIEVIGFYT